jgi:hypothetical protein
MNLFYSCLVLSASLLWTGGTSASDLAKVDRSIRKEPSYKSQPTYCLLVFGPQAKQRTWLIFDGEVLYLDRNGDGDLTGKDERFEKLIDCRDIEIADRDGKTRYVITGVRESARRESSLPRWLQIDVAIRNPTEYSQYGSIKMSDQPPKAPIAHFDGPLTAQLMRDQGRAVLQRHADALLRDDEAQELDAIIGTVDEEHGCWVVVRTHEGAKSAFPVGAALIVDAEFPAAKQGEAALKKRFVLDGFC